MSGFDKKQQILNTLADGRFHSGETLGKMLGISRAATGKHISQLRDLGIEIFSAQGKGYSLLSNLVLLSQDKINGYYNKLADDALVIDVKHVINSTNDNLLQKIRNNETLKSGDSVVAECQTMGRGRRGRNWLSPFGSHIYFSMYWQLDGIQKTMGLSIAVGLAVRETIQSFVGNDVQVKWPNDLLIERMKIAGILVELEGQADGPCEIVIGIGINVTMPQLQGEQIDQPWTDMATYCNESVDRNALVALLICKLKQRLRQFECHGLSQSVEQWNEYDSYYNQPIELIMGSRRLSGIGKGIDEQGGIVIVEKGTSVEKAYYGGEISLRGKA